MAQQSPPRQTLFKRVVNVRVAVPVKGYAQTGSLVLEVSALRVQFKVKKTTKKEPNTCEVVISNLNADHRALLQQQGGKFILLAGYESTGAEQLFIGDVRNVAHVRDAADWNTTIHSGDGERAYRWARINESFKGGTPVSDVLGKIVSAMGIAQGNLGTVLAGLNAQYVNGIALQGSAQRELDTILRSQGYTWSIVDGALSVLKNDTTLGGLIPEWSVDTGLVGSPEFGAAEKNKGPLVKAKHLLAPQVKPGAKIKLVSERFNGEIRVVVVDHTGDTDGGDWYTEVEGEPL